MFSPRQQGKKLHRRRFLNSQPASNETYQHFLVVTTTAQTTTACHINSVDFDQLSIEF